ncbi:diacylglycerol/lipid kinase family protein [Microbacterium koreense]|uniref:Diacylglycerol/lipid kinase family protein n=1 Tax=Microbacterium koreense TaxID=323761 RepID=A0ABW2ZMN9_9MICO
MANAEDPHTDSPRDEGAVAGTDAPDPEQAAAPDDVIHEPEDVAPDHSGHGGDARRVDEEGDTASFAGGGERPTPKAALVYNPIKTDGDALRELVGRESEKAGWAEPLYYETTVDDLGDDVTREALDAGATVVLVAGGDGTVRAVSEAMSGTDVPLAIVPSGTGNLLARNLHLPLTDPRAMVRAAFQGDTLAMDVGWAALRRADGERVEHAFVVMGGMGLDAAMIANTNPDLKRTVGWVAYVDGAARSLANAKPFRVMYQLVGHRLHSVRVQSLLFANCGSLPAGLELVPDASITDGALDIVIVQPKGPLGWMFVWRRVAWDNSVLRRFRAGRRVLALRTKDNAIIYSRGGGIDVASSEAHPVQLDGDEFGEAVEIRVRVERGHLRIAVPRGHAVDGL